MQVQELNVYSIVSFNDKLLLLKNKNGFWEFPGGGVDFGEEPITSAHRELKEETTLIAKELTLIGVTSAVYEKEGNEKHSVYIVYKGDVHSDRVFISSEHSEYRWVTKDEAKFMKLGLNAESALEFL